LEEKKFGRQPVTKAVVLALEAPKGSKTGKTPGKKKRRIEAERSVGEGNGSATSNEDLESSPGHRNRSPGESQPTGARPHPRKYLF